MGFFSALAKTMMEVVETPIAIIKDVATLGSQLTDEGKPYTVRQAEKIQQGWNKMKKSLDEQE